MNCCFNSNVLHFSLKWRAGGPSIFAVFFFATHHLPLAPPCNPDPVLDEPCYGSTVSPPIRSAGERPCPQPKRLTRMPHRKQACSRAAEDACSSDVNRLCRSVALKIIHSFCDSGISMGRRTVKPVHSMCRIDARCAGHDICVNG